MACLDSARSSPPDAVEVTRRQPPRRPRAILEHPTPRLPSRPRHRNIAWSPLWHVGRGPGNGPGHPTRQPGVSPAPTCWAAVHSRERDWCPGWPNPGVRDTRQPTAAARADGLWAKNGSTRRAASRARGAWSPAGQDIWLCSLATSGTCNRVSGRHSMVQAAQAVQRRWRRSGRRAPAGPAGGRLALRSPRAAHRARPRAWPRPGT